MKHYDVVIVGAGLAGLQLARLLGRQSHKVLLVDCKRSLNDSIHTTGIFVRRTLEDFDIPDDCLGAPIRDVALYSPSRRMLKLSSKHDEFRIGRMGILYDRLLTQALRDGVAWMPSTRYAGHHSAKGQSTVWLNSTNSSPVKTRYLVGADGANSRVARHLGLDLNQKWIVGVEGVYTNVQFDGPPSLHCFLDPKLAPGYLAWFAWDGEEAHVGVGGYPSLFDPSSALEALCFSLRNMVDFNKASLIERRGGRIPVGGVLKNIANENGLLIGDAAGAVSPLTAGGLDGCMRLSRHAARVISEYITTSDPGILEQYSGELFHARFTSRLWMRQVLEHSKNSLLMEVAFSILRMPPFESLARHVFFGRGSFPEMNDELIPQEVFLN